MTNARADKRGKADNPWQLFGIDLAGIGRAWVEGWQEALRWPAFAWLRPRSVIEVTMPDGGRRMYANGHWLADDKSDTAAQYQAVVLPDNLLLSRQLTLPPLSGDDLQQALVFEVEGLTPFGMEGTVWGYRAIDHAGVKRVELVICSRAHAARQLVESAISGQDPEIWALDADEQPVVMQGFGERRRLVRERSQVRLVAVLGLLAALLSLTLVAVPVLDAHRRLSSAEQAYAQLQNRVSKVSSDREKLVNQATVAQAIADHLRQVPQPLLLLDLLSGVIPDTAYLERIDINGSHVRLVGQAENASSLMQILGKTKGFDNVQAPTAITRNSRTGKERFVIEFDLGASKSTTGGQS